MIMSFDPPCGRGSEGREIADVIGEVVQEYLGNTPVVEIIGVLEPAKAYVIKLPSRNYRGVRKSRVRISPSRPLLFLINPSFS